MVERRMVRVHQHVWFNNVERIGRETMTYVSNIYKCYVTYLLIQGEYIQRRDLKRKAVGGGSSIH